MPPTVDKRFFETNMIVIANIQENFRHLSFVYIFSCNSNLNSTLLQLNEASRDLLMKMLDNATQQTLLRQAKVITHLQ